MDNQEIKSSNMVGALSGLAVGAILGLLFAPKRGSDTRADVSDWIKRNARKTRQLALELKGKFPSKDKVSETYANAKQVGSSVLRDLKEKASSAVHN